MKSPRLRMRFILPKTWPVRSAVYGQFKNREVAGKQPRSYYQDGHDEGPFHSGIVVTTPNVSNWTKHPSTGSKNARINLNYLTSPSPLFFFFILMMNAL